jgi:hypothetical protein
MNETLRDNIWELFGDAIIYDSPISDDDIIGMGLIYDSDCNWVVVYDESKVINTLIQEFSGSEDPETDAIEYYNYNIIGGYLGPQTPIFMNDFEFHECMASRCSDTYETYFKLDSVSSLYEAYELVSNKKTFLFVPLDELESIKNII